MQVSRRASTIRSRGMDMADMARDIMVQNLRQVMMIQLKK